MGQKHPANVAERNAQLMQPLHRPAAGVENKFLLADFDQCARPETIQARRRRAGAEQRHAKFIVSGLRHR